MILNQFRVKSLCTFGIVKKIASFAKDFIGIINFNFIVVFPLTATITNIISLRPKIIACCLSVGPTCCSLLSFTSCLEAS